MSQKNASPQWREPAGTGSMQSAPLAWLYESSTGIYEPTTNRARATHEWVEVSDGVLEVQAIGSGSGVLSVMLSGSIMHMTGV